MYVVVRKGTKQLIWPNVYGSFRLAQFAIEEREFEDIAEVYQLIVISA